MIHPGLNNIAEFSDRQLEEKLLKLNSVYFVTENPEVRQQILLIIDSFKLELEARRAHAKLEQESKGKDDLDKLINIS